jgi:hypothetical protein
MANTNRYYRAFDGTYERAEDGSHTVTISTPAVDRFNTRLNPDGWHLDNYKRNPVVLWAHQRDMLPIATCKRVWSEDGKLRAKIEWVDRDLNPFADVVRKMYERGILKGWSVGFLPVGDTKMPEKAGDPINFAGQELVEFSAAPVPANPETLSDDVTGSRDMSGYALMTRALEAAAGIEHRTVPSVDPHTRTVADKIWDGLGARRRMAVWAGGPHPEKMNWRKFSKGFAWFDSGNRASFVSYKLAHHDVENGSLVTVWLGVRAAMEALMGARGGVRIPEAEWDAAYEHLATHYRQFDKTPPEKAVAREALSMAMNEREEAGILNRDLGRAIEMLAAGEHEEALEALQTLQERGMRFESRLAGSHLKRLQRAIGHIRAVIKAGSPADGAGSEGDDADADKTQQAALSRAKNTAKADDGNDYEDDAPGENEDDGNDKSSRKRGGKRPVPKPGKGADADTWDETGTDSVEPREFEDGDRTAGGTENDSDDELNPVDAGKHGPHGRKAKDDGDDGGDDDSGDMPGEDNSDDDPNTRKRTKKRAKGRVQADVNDDDNEDDTAEDTVDDDPSSLTSKDKTKRVNVGETDKTKQPHEKKRSADEVLGGDEFAGFIIEG